MGLCKCPKKRVTNLFCYEHRVNVCEHCLVENHRSCIVQSYLAWLQDSDYDPRCVVCEQNLTDGHQSTVNSTVRLTCLHVFHQHCLNLYYQKLPPNTAPAGFKCPVCTDRLFPKENQFSPIANDLRNFLKNFNWARAGLGLPLLPEFENSSSVLGPSHEAVHGQLNVVDYVHSIAEHGASNVQNSTVIGMEVHGAVSSNEASGTVDDFISPTARKAVLTGSSSDIHPANAKSGTNGDADENKYKRRSALVWFSRWLRSRSGPVRRDPLSPYKRMFFLMLMMLIGFVTVITVVTRVGRSHAESDPLLNPLANPNIRVAADKVSDS